MGAAASDGPSSVMTSPLGPALPGGRTLPGLGPRKLKVSSIRSGSVVRIRDIYPNLYIPGYWLLIIALALAISA